MAAATRSQRTKPDTREMVLAHNVFRRIFGDLPWLIADVADGDLARAGVLADLYVEASTALRHHHELEDELLWPKLLPRVDTDRAYVLRAEEQHERVHELIERATKQVNAFRNTATAASRGAVEGTLGELFTALTEHLDEEERTILPLVEDHLSVAEWDELGERARANMPKNRLLIQLGWLLDGIPQDEQRVFLAKLPLAARVLWRISGRRQWHKERLRIYEH